MENDEKRIRHEDCNEDTVGTGILTLTNKRIAFDKKSSRIMDLSIRMGDTVIDLPLENISKVWKEGRFLKKICVTGKIDNDEKTFKFGVFNSGSWLKSINEVLSKR